MAEIVKVQIPLAGNSGTLPMIYDKLRKRTSLQPLDAAAVKAMGYDVKAFFEARWDVNSRQWKLGQRVASQLW